MTRIDTDICVIGGGSGGLSVAAGAVQMGAKVVLVEKGEMGGDCLNTGCIPSKSLLHAAAHQMSWDAAHTHLRQVIEKIAPHDSQERFEGLGCLVFRDHARFVGRREIEVGETRVRARRFVIATGAGPAIPDLPGLDAIPFLTNETIFDLEEKPAHLLIIGGGAVGLEMAQAHRQFGCEVTVVEAGEPIGREDPDAASLLLDELRGEGIEIATKADIVRLRKNDKVIELVTSDGRTISGSHLLIATGRKPSIEGLGLEAAGIETMNGAIKVNARLRTSNRRVFAIGDVTGGAQFTHVAGYQAGVVIRPTVFRLPAKARTDHIPRCIYTTPELAQVGMTEQEAREVYGGRIEVVRADMAANDRAVATGETMGFLKVVVLGGRPIGATLIADDAGELISPWSLALSKKLKLSDISGMILPYPTRSEISKRAAGNYFSPRLFENEKIKRVVRWLQKLVP